MGRVKHCWMNVCYVNQIKGSKELIEMRKQRYFATLICPYWLMILGNEEKKTSHDFHKIFVFYLKYFFLFQFCILCRNEMTVMIEKYMFIFEQYLRVKRQLMINLPTFDDSRQPWSQQYHVWSPREGKGIQNGQKTDCMTSEQFLLFIDDCTLQSPQIIFLATDEVVFYQ